MSSAVDDKLSVRSSVAIGVVSQTQKTIPCDADDWDGQEESHVPHCVCAAMAAPESPYARFEGGAIEQRKH